MNEKRPLVGMGICVVKDGKALFGQRLNAHGEGTWCFPGGHLEFSESLEDCARREVSEETGIKIKNIRFITITNNVFEKENKHYITIYMQADWAVGEPQVLEPDKMVKWQWFEWSKAPEPLFLPMQSLLKSGFNPL